MPITTYLRRHLAGRLAAYGLTDHQIMTVTDDVHGRLVSLVSHWNDPALRAALLLPGREEATFYEPAWADLDVRSLVVVAIRNSVIENLASTPEASRQLGVANQVILDRDIPTITSEAIRYFSDLDLSDVADSLDGGAGRRDVFANLPTDYPSAWRAISQLSGLTGAECSYDPVTVKPLILAVGRSLPLGWNDGLARSQVLSGMERAIDPSLQRVLRLVMNGIMPALFSDSFKMITRNPAKLFEVLEFVLGNGRVVVTHNYVLKNGYVARRIPLLRPAHTVQEARDKFRDSTGLLPCHERALREIAAYL